MAMKLSTGKVKFSVEFDNGDVEYIYFNPKDRTFIRRIMDFEKSIGERIKKIDVEKYKSKIEDGINLNIDFTDITAVEKLTDEQVQSLKNKMNTVLDMDEEFQKSVKEELNEIFESDISSVVFKYCQPLDDVFITDEKGEPTTVVYLLQFLQEFQKELRQYQSKVTPAMQKHIGKYAK